MEIFSDCKADWVYDSSPHVIYCSMYFSTIVMFRINCICYPESS